MKFEKGGRKFDSTGLGFSGVLLDVSGTDFDWKSQTVTTSAVLLGIGAITTPGYILIKNIATAGGTNYVEVRDGSGGADVVKIRPQGIALFEAASATLYVIANLASAEILYAVVEA